MSRLGAYLLVKAEVVPDLREQFDGWYESDHLPEAKQRLRARRAWRFWSDADVPVHYALYEFTGAAEVYERLGSAAGSWLIADFDARWSVGVTRTREVICLVQELHERTDHVDP